MLSSNDSAVLTQLFDPESAPSVGVIVDETLPEDPQYPDSAVWNELKHQEKSIVLRAESILANGESRSSLQQVAKDMNALIETYPSGACLYNDYAQVIRMQYGNSLCSDLHSGVLAEVLRTLDKAITLLKPTTIQEAVSPAQCRTLAQAHTQRGALFHGLATFLAKSPSQKLTIPALADLTIVDFQEAASKDFFMGGRYGSEVGRALAVHTNPTAKLCGQMVQQAMRKEYSMA